MARFDASIDLTIHPVPACSPLASGAIEAVGVAFAAEKSGGAGGRLVAPRLASA